MKKQINFFYALFFLILFLFNINSFCYAQWTKTNGPYGGWCISMYSTNGYLYAGTFHSGILRSSDNGNNWSFVFNFSVYDGVKDITSNSQYLFITSGANGVFRSSNNGDNWQQVNNGANYSYYLAHNIITSGQYVICGSYKLFRSSNNGELWDSCNYGMHATYIYSLSKIGNNVYAGTDSGAYVSTNDGAGWNAINNGITTQHVEKITSDGTNLYAATHSGIFKSSNNGMQWNPINNGLPLTLYYDIIYDGTYLLTTTSNGMYRTSNSGASWEECNNGLISLTCFKYYGSGNRLFAIISSGVGVQYTTNHGSNWEISNTGFNAFQAYALARKDNLIFAGGYSSGLAVSSDDGASWNAIYNNLITQKIFHVAANSNCIFVSVDSKGVVKSSDNGLNWSLCTNGINSNQIITLFAYDDVVFASSINGVTFRTTNDGESWTSFNAPGTINAMARIGDVFVAGNNWATKGGIIRSTDKGSTWNLIPAYMPSGIAQKDNVFYMFSIPGFYKSTDLGLNWITISYDYTNNIKKLYVVDDKLVLLSDTNIFTSSDNGISWIPRNQGINLAGTINDFCEKGNNVFIGTGAAGVWKRIKTDFVSITNLSTEIPNYYFLSQNYPNPFNPITNIKFAIPQSGIVKISVYDLSGKEIINLVNEYLQAGTYQTKWDATDFSSGLYFYKIISGNFTETKKMILVK